MVCLQFPSRTPWPWHSSWALFLCTILLLLQYSPTNAIKFSLQSFRYPPQKCIWNPAHADALVIVTANVGPGVGQRVDVEIIDSSPQHNKYLSKRGINGETRLAVTTHAEGDVGVCFRNFLDSCRVFDRFSVSYV
jgi:p24 family protein delta-1